MNKIFSIFLLALVLSLTGSEAKAEDQVKKISIQELKAKMDNGKNIFLIDVRVKKTGNGNNLIIKGAVRIPVTEIAEKAHTIPMGTEIITYCA